jgi:hypothetical protein
VGRGPSVDHEAVMDFEEPSILVVALGIFLLVILLDAYVILRSMWQSSRLWFVGPLW